MAEALLHIPAKDILTPPLPLAAKHSLPKTSLICLHRYGSNTVPDFYIYGYEGTNVTEAKATSNYNTYDVLYNWSAAMTACPGCWHLPSDEEWTTLTDYLVGENIAEGKLKEFETTHWKSPNTGATNSSDFTGLPVGDSGKNGTFYILGLIGYWWLSSVGLGSGAWERYLSHSTDRVNNRYKAAALTSVV